MRDPFGLACALVHPFAPVKGLRLSDIDHDRLVGLEGQTGTYQLLRQSGLPPAFLSPRLQAFSTGARFSMGRVCPGVALLSRTAGTLFRDPAICLVPVIDLDLWRTLCLLEPQRHPLSQAVRPLIAGFVQIDQRRSST